MLRIRSDLVLTTLDERPAHTVPQPACCRMRVACMARARAAARRLYGWGPALLEDLLVVSVGKVTYTQVEGLVRVQDLDPEPTGLQQR